MLPSHAQVLYGSLTGTVTDSTGAALAGAKIEALNTKTGVSRAATTNESGVYNFPAIQPGTYKITITADKFVSQVTDSVDVIVNNVRRIDAALKVASTSQDVTVTAEAPVLQTDKADVHTDVTASQIGNLPITSSVGGRNFQALLRVVPGFGNLEEANSAGANPQRAMSTNVNGQSKQGNNTRIDGAQNAYPWLPANVAYVPPADSVETVNIVTNSFDPEQGMAGGAAINVQIKSGTNTFHGSGHEFFTDQALRARNYFQTDLTRYPTKPRNEMNQFGGTFGGPIIKNKLFFFTDYERTTQRQLAKPSTGYTLPSQAMRNGDFSSFIPAGTDCNANPVAGCIYDPTNVVGGKPQWFTGNIIPTGRIDPAAATLLSNLPLPTSSATTNNFLPQGTAEYNRNDFDVKVNWISSAKSTIFGRYSISWSGIYDPPSFGEMGGNPLAGGQLGNSNGRIQSVGLGGTYAFTPSVIADWNIGFTRQRLGATNIDIDQAYGLETLKIPGTNGAGTVGDASLYNGVPAFQICISTNSCNTNSGSGVTNLGNTNTGNPFLFRDNQYVWGTNLSWVHGKHNFRFGVEFNHTQMNHFQPQGADGVLSTARGSFNFNGNLTSSAGNNGTNVANAWSQFLLGLSNWTGKAILSQNPVAIRWTQWAWFARDQWQVTPKLTLTLGLRWEYYPWGYSDNGNGLPLFNPNDLKVYIGGNGGVPGDSGMNVNGGMWLPRVGAAYRLTSSTVLRAGYGMSAQPDSWHANRNAYPATITSLYGTQSGTAAVTSLTGKNAIGALASIPTGIVMIPVPNITSGVIPLPAGASTRGWANPFDRGYINSYNLMLQQELYGFSLEAGYVGAFAVRPLTQINTNASQVCPVAGFNSSGAALLPNGQVRTGASCAAAGYGRILSTTISDVNSLIPFKNNYYNSFQTKVTRRFTNGSQIGMVYTFSKTINYAENEDLNGMLNANPANWNLNKSLANFDRPHNFQLYGVWGLPFGKGQKYANSGGVKDYFIGGWQVSGVLSRLSGTPFHVTANGSFLNPNNSAGLQNYADQVGSYQVLGGKPWSLAGTCPLSNLSCHYFDPAAFAQPQLGVFGNTRRNEFRGPGIFSADISLSKDFKITERVNFQFRTDIFGLTNTPRFQNPNNGCGSSAALSNCSTASQSNNFGAITSTSGTAGSNASTDGARTIWFSGKITF